MVPVVVLVPGVVVVIVPDVVVPAPEGVAWAPGVVADAPGVVACGVGDAVDGVGLAVWARGVAVPTAEPDVPVTCAAATMVAPASNTEPNPENRNFAFIFFINPSKAGVGFQAKFRMNGTPSVSSNSPNYAEMRG